MKKGSVSRTYEVVEVGFISLLYLLSFFFPLSSTLVAERR
jgi:hypothetical protein